MSNENLFINKRMYMNRNQNLLSLGRILRGTNIVRMLQNYLKQKTNESARLSLSFTSL